MRLETAIAESFLPSGVGVYTQVQTQHMGLKVPVARVVAAVQAAVGAAVWITAVAMVAAQVILMAKLEYLLES